MHHHLKCLDSLQELVKNKNVKKKDYKNFVRETKYKEINIIRIN